MWKEIKGNFWYSAFPRVATTTSFSRQVTMWSFRLCTRWSSRKSSRCYVIRTMSWDGLCWRTVSPGCASSSEDRKVCFVSPAKKKLRPQWMDSLVLRNWEFCAFSERCASFSHDYLLEWQGTKHRSLAPRNSSCHNHWLCSHCCDGVTFSMTGTWGELSSTALWVLQLTLAGRVLQFSSLCCSRLFPSVSAVFWFYPFCGVSHRVKLLTLSFFRVWVMWKNLSFTKHWKLWQHSRNLDCCRNQYCTKCWQISCLSSVIQLVFYQEKFFKHKQISLSMNLSFSSWLVRIYGCSI